MRLSQLVAGLDVEAVRGDDSVEITGVTHDSRAVGPGALFCCVPGATVDGHDFGGEAVSAGAVALLCERPVDAGATEVEVADVRRTMPLVAAAFHGQPSRAMRVVGVTGTNGKTTTVHLLQAILTAHGWPTETIGTLTGARTTPEATELQARLASLRESGTRAVAMEVSSHALDLHRVDGTWFEVAVFTNLSRDHLDFHRSMDDYFAAKARLFQAERTGAAVLNADDPYVRRLIESATVPFETYSLDDVTDLEIGLIDSRFRWEGVDVRVPLGGAFNVSNALAAAVAARRLGVPPSEIAAGLDAADPVPGRFEPVDAGQSFRVVVDYAHTPDGLEHLLAAARDVVAEGRVLLVFGCGGDRDRTKRPEMGAVAARLADVVVVTSDNPRSEDPLAIIDEVLAGIDDRPVVVEPDRRAAIAHAVADARPGDLVVVAGKGHETTQTTGELVVPFDDRQVVREELANLCGSRGC